MDQVGGKALHVAADCGRYAEREAELGANRQGDRVHRDERALGLECGGVGDWRIDPHLVAGAFEMADEAIERLVRAFAQIIVIAREERDPERGHRLRKLSTALSTNSTSPANIEV